MTAYTLVDKRARRAHLQRHAGARRGLLDLQRRVQLLLAATAITSIGDGVLYVTLPLAAAATGHGAAAVAAIMVAQRAPWLLVGIPAGRFADRVPRRLAVCVSELSRFAVLVVATACIARGTATTALLAGLAFALGSAEAVYRATIGAVVPEMVDAGSDEPRAGINSAPINLDKLNARLNTTEFAGQFFVGPAIGGALYAARAWLPFAVDGISFALTAALLALALGSLGRPQAVGAAPAVPAKRVSHRRSSGALREIAAQPSLRLAVGTVAVYAGCQSAVLALMVFYARRNLHLDARGFGLLMTMGALGDIIGGVLAPRLIRRLGHGRLVALCGVAAGAAYLGLGTVAHLVAAVLLLIVEMTAVSAGMVASMTMRQRLVDPERRGTLLNASRVVVQSATIVGALGVIPLVAVLGVRATYMLAGLGQVAFCLVFLRRLGAIRLPAAVSTAPARTSESVAMHARRASRVGPCATMAAWSRNAAVPNKRPRSSAEPMSSTGSERRPTLPPPVRVASSS